MKKKFLLTIGLVAILATISLQVKPASQKHTDPLVSYLEKELLFPDFLRTRLSQAVVFVSLTADETGKITVLQTNASDPEMNNYVIGYLENIQLEYGVAEPGKMYCLKIVFNNKSN